MLLASALGGHALHIAGDGLAVALALAVIAVELYRERRRTPVTEGAPQGSARISRLTALVAAAVLGAATIHVAATPVHFRESLVLGGFFLVLSCLQLGYAAALLLNPTALLLRAGLLGNAAVALLWVYTRTAGIPFGVGGGEVEAIGIPDLLANVLGVVAALAAWQVLRELHGRRIAPRLGIAGPQAAYALIVVASASAVVSTTGLT